jgi:hypothetical protein
MSRYVGPERIKRPLYSPEDHQNIIATKGTAPEQEVADWFEPWRI